MRNNRGFGKFESLTVLVILIGFMAFFLHSTLGGVSKKQLNKFKDYSVTFSKAVYMNIDSYKNPSIVYLEEAVDQGFVEKTKSPFSTETCDYSESKVETEGLSSRFVTLKCDQFLIYREKTSDLSHVTIYEVSEWNLEKPEGENVDEAVLYNCQRADGSLVFPKYREEYSFLYGYNKLYSQNYRNIADIKTNSCTVVSNTFYRTREEYKEK